MPAVVMMKIVIKASEPGNTYVRRSIPITCVRKESQNKISPAGKRREACSRLLKAKVVNNPNNNPYSR